MHPTSCPSLLACLSAFLLAFSSAGPLSAQNQLPNLPDTPTAARFTITDRTWPANPGEASICLWADDKLAALSFTVDDNTQPDIAWWEQMSQTYGFPVTWFVVSGIVNSSNSYWGTWAEYARLVDEGHDVQSHTVYHLDTTNPAWPGIEGEYRDSQLAIQANIPGHPVEFLAYPGGANSSLNDRTLAASYYAAARGTTGFINSANGIDYLSVYAMSSPNIGNTSAPWADLQTLFNQASNTYRGWAVLIYHKVNDPAAVQPFFDFCQANASDLWMGAFGDVAKYGQERDTATLTVTGSTPQSITFTLTDRMLDSRFAYPLTVKVRLPSDWSAVKATQNGNATESSIIVRDGLPYALVKTVPDRGAVVLSRLETPLAYEDFNYAPTANVSASADSGSDYGWTGTAWTGTNDIVSPGLSQIAVGSSGNALQVSSNISSARSIDMSAMPASLIQVDTDGVTRLGKPGTTLWVRFLIRPDAADPGNTATAAVSLAGASVGGTMKLIIGDLGSALTWGIVNGSATWLPAAYSPDTISTGTTTLLVARIKFVPGTSNDEVDLFVNPPAGPTPPAIPSASLRGIDIGTFDRLDLRGNRLSTIDEVLIAQDWSSVLLEPTVITSNGVTWTIAGPHQTGLFANGDPWVVGPVTITSIANSLNSPAYTPKPGQNGSMLNPVTTGKQGYDSGLSNYLASLNAGLPNGLPVSTSNPLIVPTGSTLVSSVSWLYNSSSDCEPGTPAFSGGTPRPVNRSAGILTVLGAPAPANAFRPPYCGDDKSIRYFASEINYRRLPLLSPPSGVTPPTFASLADSFSRTWLDHVNEWQGDWTHPSEHMPHYGRDMARLIGDATLRLFTDNSAPGGNSDKDRLLVGLVQLGIDLTGIADNGGGWPANGGISVGRKWPILFAGALLNDDEMLSAGYWDTRFQENEQTFYVSQAEVDLTNSPAWRPDTRTATIPYTTADIGTPEWGIRHAADPEVDNAAWEAVYRDVNGCVIPAFALAAREMNLKATWNHDAFFDYCDRYMDWRLNSSPEVNAPSAFLSGMWYTHRPSAP